MPTESSNSRVDAFVKIATVLLAIGAFVQGLSNHQNNASTETASRKSYGLVGDQLQQVGQSSALQTDAIEKLWEAVSALQSRQSMPASVVAENRRQAVHHPRPPAIAAPVPPPGLSGTPTLPATPTGIPQATPTPASTAAETPRAKLDLRLGQLELRRTLPKRLPAFDELKR
jgi:hypothetical protein